MDVLQRITCVQTRLEERHFGFIEGPKVVFTLGPSFLFGINLYFRRNMQGGLYFSFLLNIFMISL